MTRHPMKSAGTGLMLIAVLLTTGCERDEEDLRPLVKDLIEKQAAQQESLLRQSEHLTEASRQMVESDAEARRELIEFQSALQTEFESERHDLDLQRNDLEKERRTIAAQRHRDPLIAAALIQAATLLTAALPILLVVLLLRAAIREPADAPMGELLVREFTSDNPSLLPWDAKLSSRLEHHPAAEGEPGSGKSDGRTS